VLKPSIRAGRRVTELVDYVVGPLSASDTREGGRNGGLRSEVVDSRDVRFVTGILRLKKL
jgi:hypothetical protein